MKRTLKISLAALLVYSLLPFAIYNVYASTPELACGNFHTVGLKTDGTVVAVGPNSMGQCDVGGWTNIQQVAASYNQKLCLMN